ncbi:MAG TPA: hypothetical protein PLL50_10090 [Propionicimonas sp.]|nr:hypothetical protein [Propionicimonas sp.]
MRACWTRVVTLVAAAVAALLLTGCEIEGSVDVVSSEQVALDLTFTGTAEDCQQFPDSSVYGLTVDTTYDDDQATCRMYGTVDARTLADVFPYFVATEVGDHYLFSTRFGGYSFDSVDVTVGFPGDVVSATRGEVSGNQVRLTDPADFSGENEVVKIVAHSRPGAQWWPALLAGGSVLAAGAAFVVGLLVGRRRRDASEAAETFDLTPDVGRPIDRSWYAPDAHTRVPTEPATGDFRAPSGPADHSAWAPPAEGESDSS